MRPAGSLRQSATMPSPPSSNRPSLTYKKRVKMKKKNRSKPRVKVREEAIIIINALKTSKMLTSLADKARSRKTR